MYRSFLVALIAAVMISSSVAANEIRGTYVEARTCQVYTGPCFANGEVGLTGKNAVLSWNISDGSHDGVSLAGRSVAVVVTTSHTLGFQGFDDAKILKAAIFVDDAASTSQQEALRRFVLAQTGISADQVRTVRAAPIQMTFNAVELTADLEIGKLVKLQTRKARPGDCICSNESAYYPPLVKLSGFVPGVTIEGEVSARSLGSRWSIPDSRTAYMGTFEANSAGTALAQL